MYIVGEMIGHIKWNSNSEVHLKHREKISKTDVTASSFECSYFILNLQTKMTILILSAT